MSDTQQNPEDLAATFVDGRGSHDPLGLTGRTVGDVMIEGMIGEGNMGVVYLGKQLRLDRAVAVKVSNDPESKKSLERFGREARAAACITHPCVAQVYALELTPEGLPCIVMELVRGRTVEGLLAAGQGLDYRMVLHIGIEVARGLDAIHREGLVHRDIKPANIMVTDRNAVKIMDLGVAKVLSGGEGEHLRHTRTGGMCGTPLYMAPEQLFGKEIDCRADLYALGVMLYEMLTGKHPYPSRTFVELVENIRTRRFRGPRTVVPETPDSLDACVMKLLAVEPEARFASAESLMVQLQAVSTDVDHRVRPADSHEMAELGSAPERTVRIAPEDFTPPEGMAYLPPGWFTMGSARQDAEWVGETWGVPVEAMENEIPAHEVLLEGFCLDLKSVTNVQYAEFLAAARAAGPGAFLHRSAPPDKDHTPSHWQEGRIPPGHEDRPVVFVDWYDAWAYARWAKKRLPTEAEWEKAARYDSDEDRSRIFPWGDAWEDEVCHSAASIADPFMDWEIFESLLREPPFNDPRAALAAQPGSYPNGRSPCGCLDMSGNVHEWCADWYARDYYHQRRPGSSSPRGPRRSEVRAPLKVVRGGGWNSPPWDVRAARRFALNPVSRKGWLGFRCAMGIGSAVDENQE